jgi:hypothetical protein
MSEFRSDISFEGNFIGDLVRKKSVVARETKNELIDGAAPC